jgi:diguanylate cyclase (GGDEF)-like protein
VSRTGAGDRGTSRLLVVDDDPQTARLIRSWFEGRPYEILAAESGQRCLELARRKKPDLILLDLRMPGLDGLAVARLLKADRTFQSIPVILLTAVRDLQEKVEAFAAGADDYVTKPFAFEEVDARIRAMLRKRELYVELERTVTDLKASNQQLEELLIVDEKTGLHNYRQFRRTLDQEWLRSERYKTPLSLVMLDLDDFKSVNDSLGHQAGDQALREFATLVAGGARATDLAARYGGEEFAIILPHTEGSMAVRVAERVREAAGQFVFLEDVKPLRLTVSAGAATYPSFVDVDSPEGLVRAADRALYRAKQSGKDRVVADTGEPAAERGAGRPADDPVGETAIEARERALLPGRE